MGSLCNGKQQYLAGISANILSISYGCVYGWTSASFVYLQDESHHFETGILTKEQLGWVTAAIFPGSILGAIFFGWLADKIGRKRCLLFAALPMYTGLSYPLLGIPCN